MLACVLTIAAVMALFLAAGGATGWADEGARESDRQKSDDAHPSFKPGLEIEHGKLECEAYPCSGFLPQAESFRHVEGTSAPVLAALQGGEVFAYVFLSTDLVDIPAYSGKPLVTMIAMDPQGNILDARVIQHHEPILLVGIPESVLDEYLKQFLGRNIAQQELDLEEPAQKPLKMRQPPPATVQVHMITGATVTALVLEETLFSSAREAGRALGIITEGARRQITWHADYAPKSWQELVDEGSIGHLRVEAREMDTAASGELPWIDLYFGDLGPPVIGINLLGESTYDWLKGHLKPGEQALFVVGNGISSFKGSGFVRGGIFDRFHLEQGLRKFTFKDLDYENLYGIEAEGAPQFRESGIFFLRDPSFDSTLPLTFVYLASRLTGETARSKAFKAFSTEYKLPEKYYDVQETAAPKRPSMIARIWAGDRTEAIVLAGFLALVMGIFFMRRWLTAGRRRLEWVHNTVLIASVLIVGLWLHTPPSVTQLFPFVGVFQHGLRLDLFLSDPLLFVFWIFIALSLILWGRGWFCGWVCPYGALLELIHVAAVRVLPAKAIYEFPQRVHDVLRRVRYVVLAVLLVLSVFSLEWAERLAEVEPFKTTWLVGVFHREWYLGLYWWALIALAIFNLRFFCRYLCPLGAALSIGTVFRLIGIKRKEFCTRCKICARGCGSRAINPQGQINRYECLYCMECEQKYHDDFACPPLIVARRQAEKAVAGAAPAGTLKPPPGGASTGVQG